MTIERQFRFGELRTGPRVGASAERRGAALATRTRRSCPSPCLLPWAVRGAGGGAGIAAPRASGAREGHGPQGPFPRPRARGRRAAPSALRVRVASSPRRPRQLSLVVLMENSPRRGELVPYWRLPREVQKGPGPQGGRRGLCSRRVSVAPTGASADFHSRYY